MSIEYVAYFESDLGIADLVLASIGLFDVVSSRILGGSVFEEFFESFEVVALDSLFNEDSHGELLRNDDFICGNPGIAGNDASSEFACLLAHYFAANGAFFATKQGLK